MFLNLILIFVGFWICYSIIPTIYYKFFYKENYKEGVLEFTFDDGPNPEFTPRIRELLEDNSTRAIFFVVGEKVEKYPEIVKSTYSAGHKIGLHCYRHTHPLFWGPIKTRSDMERSKNILENLQIKPSFYRPPHGWVNLSMLFVLKKWQLPLKLWTNIPGDWEEKKPWEEIYKEIKKESEKGGVICLHDSNHKIDSLSKAPENTINALREFFKK